MHSSLLCLKAKENQGPIYPHTDVDNYLESGRMASFALLPNCLPSINSRKINHRMAVTVFSKTYCAVYRSRFGTALRNVLYNLSQSPINSPFSPPITAFHSRNIPLNETAETGMVAVRPKNKGESGEGGSDPWLSCRPCSIQQGVSALCDIAKVDFQNHLHLALLTF